MYRYVLVVVSSRHLRYYRDALKVNIMFIIWLHIGWLQNVTDRQYFARTDTQSFIVTKMNNNAIWPLPAGFAVGVMVSFDMSSDESSIIV